MLFLPLLQVTFFLYSQLIQTEHFHIPTRIAKTIILILFWQTQLNFG